MKNNLESIEDSILEIKEDNLLVIVEGKKDKEALNNFDIMNIICLKNKPLFEVVEGIGEKNVVLLTDLDVEGRKLFNKLRHQLQRKGIKINNKLRNNLFKSKLRNIEGLDSYLKE